MTIQGIKVLTVVCLLISVNYLQLSSHYITKIKKPDNFLKLSGLYFVESTLFINSC